MHYARHELEAAVAATEDALGLLDALDVRAEDWLRAYAHSNLAWFMHGGGDIDGPGPGTIAYRFRTW